VMVVLPASGWDMMAKVRRLCISWSSSVIGTSEYRKQAAWTRRPWIRRHTCRRHTCRRHTCRRHTCCCKSAAAGNIVFLLAVPRVQSGQTSNSSGMAAAQSNSDRGRPRRT
jgi:hypothetical protein